MSPKITFRSTPSTWEGCPSPSFRNVTMLVNGRAWMSGFCAVERVRNEPYWTATAGIARATKFPEEIRATLGVDAEALIHELSYITGGFEKPEWVS